MDSQFRNLISSGVEPVDELLGGLERGQLYLVHGEASGKSLFGIQFLMEGLKKNENGALVIRYSPEDAVRRFARLGYDCLEDVYSGRLVILEYSDDIIQKIGKLRELTPVLRELEWLLGETHPKRLVFDPVTSVLSGSGGSIEARANEFSEWARSFGATVVLTANETHPDVINSFMPQVAESFRFGLREQGERAGRFLAYEKSTSIPDQSIEVDPSRGVFLLGRFVDNTAPQPPSIAELESIREELRSARLLAQQQDTSPLDSVDQKPESTAGTKAFERAADTGELVSDVADRGSAKTGRLTPLEEIESQLRLEAESLEPPSVEDLELAFDEITTENHPDAPAIDDLSHLIDDFSVSSTPLDLDLRDLGPAEIRKHERPTPEPSTIHEMTTFRQPDRNASLPDEDVASKAAAPRASTQSRAADRKINSAIASRAAELLLRPPGSESPTTSLDSASKRHAHTPSIRTDPEGDVTAKDFSILLIEDDPEISELISQTLGEYKLEHVHDGITGLARLISFKADLVILDFDLPVVDGFKVLTLIRSSLNVPIIIISGSRMRAIDRVMASELGADYYLTKPFSAKELKNKARQLIARHRGISSWIITTPVSSEAPPAGPSDASRDHGTVTPYKEFEQNVEKRVKSAMSGGTPFSIVGCRLPRMTANGGRVAVRLFDIVKSLVRDADLISTNSRNDLVVLLAEAGNSGARAFAGRLRERVIEELNQEPALWMRSFPELQESTEASVPSPSQPNAEKNRRASDRTRSNNHSQTDGSIDNQSSHQSDARDSYIKFLEHL